MTAPARCKGCGAAILWRYTLNGRMMPLDVETAGQALPGTYVITSDADCRPADPLFDEPGTEYRMNHWTTCPKAKDFKR